MIHYFNLSNICQDAVPIKIIVFSFRVNNIYYVTLCEIDVINNEQNNACVSMTSLPVINSNRH